MDAAPRDSTLAHGDSDAGLFDVQRWSGFARFSTRATAREALEVMAAHRVDEADARQAIADALSAAGHDAAAVARELVHPFMLDP